MHGAFIDPNKLKPTRDAPIPPRFAAAYREQVEGRIAALAKVETPSFVRQVERGAVPPP